VPLRTASDDLYGVIVLMAENGQTMMLPALGGSDQKRPA
jgi:hypothetical protein